MKSISRVIEETKGVKRPTNLHTEFQHYGVFVADELGDTKHYSLYIKLCKEVDRNLINQALNYAKGYTSARSKPKVFMWKLAELRSTQGT